MKILEVTIIVIIISASFGVVGNKINYNNFNKTNMMTSTRRAVVVGISDYKYANDLTYCDDDAREMKNTLISEGWTEDDLTMLLNSAATKNAIVNALNSMASMENSGDISLFHFSGHGTRGMIRDSALCPHDCSSTGPYIYDTDLRDIIDNYDGKFVAILDSCYSGGMDAKGNLYDQGENMQVFTYDFAGAFTETVGNDKSNRVILMACGDNEYSYESRQLGHGVFSYFSIQGLTGSADGHNGGNLDDIITAEETFNFAELKTIDYFKGTSAEQHPRMFDGDTSHDISLVEIDDDDPDPDFSPILYFTIHRIKQIDEIDPWPHGEADWSYRLSINNGEKWVDILNKEYTSDKDDSNPNNDPNRDITYNFELTTPTPEITIKVWDRDTYIPLPLIFDDSDLADVSSYSGDGRNNDIRDKRGAIFHTKYDLINDEILKIDDYSTSGDYLTTSGEGDGGSGDTNDAKVWFKISDNYNLEDFQPELKVNGDLNFGNVKKGNQKIKTLTIHNNAEPDPFDQADDLSFEITNIPSWVQSVSPEQGSIKAEKSQNVLVTVDTEDMNIQTYSDKLTISSNGGTENIPISIVVEPKVRFREIQFLNILKIFNSRFPIIFSILTT